jgi:hypothetical protein
LNFYMEKLPKTDNKYETQEGEPIAELEAAVDQLDSHATKLEREGSDVDVSQETAERVEKKVGKIRSLLKVASIGLALYGSVKVGDDVKDYTASRHEITLEVGQDGRLEYEHDDPETTRILNFLTGKENLSNEDEIHFYRELVRSEVRSILEREKYQKVIGDLEGSWDEISREAAELSALSLEELNTMEKSLPEDGAGLRLRLREIYSEQDLILHGEVQNDVDARVDEAFADAVEAGVEYDPIIEKLVWDMQKKVGAPRIRWAAPADNQKAKDVGHRVGAGRAFYTASDNTIYITPGSNAQTLGRLLVTEDSHAFQFNNEPVTSRVRSMIDEVRIQMRARVENMTRYEAQFAEYDISGTIEHEAHEVIEKRLIGEFMEEGRRLRQ